MQLGGFFTTVGLLLPLQILDTRIPVLSYLSLTYLTGRGNLEILKRASRIILVDIPMWTIMAYMDLYRVHTGTDYAGYRSRWLYNGGVTSDVIHRENGRRFLTPLLCAGCLFTGWKAACSGKSGGVRPRSARAKAAFHPVSRHPAQTSGVRKRLPFSTGFSVDVRRYNHAWLPVWISVMYIGIHSSVDTHIKLGLSITTHTGRYRCEF